MSFAKTRQHAINGTNECFKVGIFWTWTSRPLSSAILGKITDGRTKGVADQIPVLKGALSKEKLSSYVPLAVVTVCALTHIAAASQLSPPERLDCGWCA